ncbi:MAG: winged helix DNA-binding domain-containing protein [Coriobacteriia bacterium]|nr:winged helix DNA-binding domain-containing protein [Coriobacteriia bacterium]
MPEPRPRGSAEKCRAGIGRVILLHMNTDDILRMRLRAQLVESSSATSPCDVVSHLLAMQAQDYAGAVWALGLRLPGSALADVEAALTDGSIVRSWPMRGTLHFLAAEDVHWLLPLLTPRILARAAKRERDLELDEPTFERARGLFRAALTGNRRLTRPDAMALLEAGGIATTGQRGYHILWRLAQEGLLVVGPMEAKQQTFRLLAEWVPAENSLLSPEAPRGQALALLAARYFAGHGPATVADLARWCDIPKREAEAALASVEDGLVSAEHDGERYWFAPEIAKASGARAKRGSRACGRTPSVHLIPGFDEYMLGYVGRSHQLGEHLEQYGSRVASNGMLAATVVIDGQAVGVWRRTLKPQTVSFEVSAFRELYATELAGVAAEQQRYARFVGREVAPS